MARAATVYYGQPEPYYYNVRFIIKATGVKLTKSFESPYNARQFVNKLKHSKHCVLLSYPNFK